MPVNLPHCRLPPALNDWYCLHTVPADEKGVADDSEDAARNDVGVNHILDKQPASAAIQVACDCAQRVALGTRIVQPELPEHDAVPADEPFCLRSQPTVCSKKVYRSEHGRAVVMLILNCSLE